MMLSSKLAAIACLFITLTTANAQITGDWKGILNIEGNPMELLFHIQEKEGVFVTTMDIPSQGAAGIPLDSSSFENGRLYLSSGQMQLSYNGEMDGDSIQGALSQGEMSIPLVLGRHVQTLPGDPTLPSSTEELSQLMAYEKKEYKYRVEDYFSQPKASLFRLSPDGKHMSYQEKDENNKLYISVRNIETGKTQRTMDLAGDVIKGYGWLNNERLYYVKDKDGDENTHLYAVNIDGSNEIDLTPFEGVKAFLTDELKEQKDHVIVELNKNNRRVFDPYKLNVVTGELELLFENKDEDNPIQHFVFDKDGNLRAYERLVDGIQSEFYYKDRLSSEYKPVNTANWHERFLIVAFNYKSANPDEAYVVTNINSDKNRVVLYDFSTNREIKEVFSNPDYDVSSMGVSTRRGYDIDYFVYEGDKRTVVPVSDLYKELDRRAKKEFEGKSYYIVSQDDEEKTILVALQSDKLYGTYYQYDTKKKKFTLLYDLMPELKEEDMAEMRPIRFKSRDGLVIHGYITLPEAALRGEKVPLIVIPHGGPQRIRDSWGFNTETQLFASRGYASLHVNFRISGGYGKQFLEAGFKQVGRKIMDDIEDGVDYVVRQGWIDTDKIAIFGGSHGGYAALMGLIKTPDLYACAIDYCGISNIQTFFDAVPAYWQPLRRIAKIVWYDLDDPEEAKIAQEVSPVFHVDRIRKPLFVIQGANDPRVNINESDQIVRALREKGVEVPYLVKYNEGHGFSREENNLEMYRYALGFFAKCFNK